MGLFIIAASIIWWKAKKYRWNYIFIVSMITALSIGTIQITHYAYRHFLKPHQQKRIDLVLGKISDDRGVGYHLKQSLVAIADGGRKGKGFLQGVQLRGNYIPEQHTDYIFTALAEQYGFTGSIFFLAIYLLFIIRLIFLAERQKNRFSRILGYSLASLLAVHFFINILMVIGLFPVVGIPIIYVSYGGSSLLIFSVFLFLFLKADATRAEEL
jgi:rod shape determining protein RodA